MASRGHVPLATDAGGLGRPTGGPQNLWWLQILAVAALGLARLLSYAYLDGAFTVPPEHFMDRRGGRLSWLWAASPRRRPRVAARRSLARGVDGSRGPNVALAAALVLLGAFLPARLRGS